MTRGGSVYNSYFIGALVKVWNALERGYEYSILKRINYSLRGGFERLSSGSRIVNLFISNRSLIEESLLYGLYANMIDGINRGLDSMRDIMKNICKGSIVYNTIYNLFKDEYSVQRTTSLFFLVLGIGIIGVNLLKGLNQYKFYMFPILLLGISILNIGLGVSYRGILEGSHVFSFIKGIFIIDEGVDQWW